jgi:hypothetical protein
MRPATRGIHRGVVASWRRTVPRLAKALEQATVDGFVSELPGPATTTPPG